MLYQLIRVLGVTLRWAGVLHPYYTNPWGTTHAGLLQQQKDRAFKKMELPERLKGNWFAEFWKYVHDSNEIFYFFNRPIPEAMDPLDDKNEALGGALTEAHNLRVARLDIYKKDLDWHYKTTKNSPRELLSEWDYIQIDGLMPNAWYVIYVVAAIALAGVLLFVYLFISDRWNIWFGLKNTNQPDQSNVHIGCNNPDSTPSKTQSDKDAPHHHQ